MFVIRLFSHLFNIIGICLVIGNGSMEFIKSDPILEFLPDTLQVLRKSYNLDNGRMEESINLLEDWIKKQDHFVNKNFDRDYFERTLIACKGSMERAKKQIDRMCTLRTLLPKFFIAGEFRKNIQRITSLGCMMLSPKMTENRKRIFIAKMNNKPFYTSDFLDYYRSTIAFSEYLKAHDYCNGYVVIYDLREVNLTEFIRQIDLIDLRHYVTILSDGFGAKLEGLHLMSNSKLMHLMVNTIKPALSKKIAERVHVHHNVEELNSAIDAKEVLPVEYGGREMSIENIFERWLEVLTSEENEKFLARQKTFYTDETRRRVDKVNDEYMSLAGSFRTLNVD